MAANDASNKTILRILQVEDDTIQQAVVARYLEELDEYQAEITCVRDEEDAIGEFARGGFHLVIVDYHLASGTCGNCLRRMRELVPTIPIIAVSGVKSAEIAAEMIGAGADDYLAKHTITRHVLVQSVRNVLNRARAAQIRRGGAGAPHPAGSLPPY